ncbi:MAG: hypothetical protein LBS39_02665 [Campylobacteraceae bacterium]|jgi:glutamyl-tRNA synthetase|nr:hypothetical protein [Campylobacteraceae bacterium]
MKNFITRIAPTPSGFIHIGNAVNFILTYAIARHLNAALWLRIDDIDPLRTKREFIDDIFETLKWLELKYDYGAKNSNDFFKNYSFNQKYLWNRLCALKEKFPTLFYACECSRKKINGIYHGRCRELGLELKKDKSSLRIKIEPKDIICLNGKYVNLFETLGDVTLWTKDGFCSYQFASLIDDEDKKINLVVRGEDLFYSSAFQLFMAKVFGFQSFLKTTFIHHALIYDENGDKLSKSKGSYTQWRNNKDLLFQNTAKILGIKEFWEINTMGELLSCKEELERFYKNKGARIE